MEFLFGLMFFGFLFKVAFWVLLIGGALFFLRGGRFGRGRMRRSLQSWQGEDKALQIASQRFAKGEISAEEYEALKKSLA